jgi:hypothetical protein
MMEIQIRRPWNRMNYVESNTRMTENNQLQRTLEDVAVAYLSQYRRILAKESHERIARDLPNTMQSL